MALNNSYLHIVNPSPTCNNSILSQTTIKKWRLLLSTTSSNVPRGRNCMASDTFILINF